MPYVFSSHPGWDARIIAGNRNHYTQRRYRLLIHSFV